jgi:glutaredoxin-like YruB-family protein
MKKVTIYTTPSCQYCEQAKDYMKEHEIDYKYYDVSEDTDRRKEMIEKSGQMGVPVIELGDELMVGFDEERFEKMVERHKADDDDE